MFLAPRQKLLTTPLDNFMCAFHRKNCSFNRENKSNIYFWPTHLTKYSFTDYYLNENTPFQVPYPSPSSYSFSSIFNFLQ